MLLGDADRDELLDLLSRHAAQGRLDPEELGRRAGHVLAAGTREQALTVFSDLPALAPASASSRGARRGRRGHGDADAPAPGWTPTSERFRDPRSAQIMRVWTDAAGGRHYLPDE